MTGMAQPASSLSVSSMAQLTLSLIAIVALIFAIGWVLKRFKLGNLRSRGAITVLDELALGPRNESCSSASAMPRFSSASGPAGWCL